VLAGWAQKTGQEARLDARGVVEFRGAASVDFYRNGVEVEAGDAATLSALDPGAHQRMVAQVDWRHTIPDERLVYFQGSLSSTDDFGLQPRFRTHVLSMQAGRTGLAHRLALGDVAVNFSTLSTNQGIRGLWGDYQLQRSTFTYFAGSVAESWEALVGARPRVGGAANLMPIRDVMGLKADHALSDTLTGFVTAQGYRDRRGELAEAALFSGQSASIGLRYASPATQAALEVATSRREDRKTNAADTRGDAIQAHAQHTFGKLAVRGGYNALDPGFFTLAQAMAPGIREVHAGGDWQISPQLFYGLDWRDSTSRTLVAQLAARTELESLTHRLGYRFADWPGLAATLSQQSTSSRDAMLQTTETDTLQARLNYAAGNWNGQMLAGRTESCATACTRQRQWQLGAGHNFLGDGQSLTLSATLGQTFSRPPLASEQRQDQVAVNATYSHGRWGQWVAGTQWQALSGGLGVPRLVTRGLMLDWNLPAGEALSVKSFVRLQERNRNDATRSVRENTAGVQMSYVW
jgi:hypothetical protein